MGVWLCKECFRRVGDVVRQRAKSLSDATTSPEYASLLPGYTCLSPLGVVGVNVEPGL